MPVECGSCILQPGQCSDGDTQISAQVAAGGVPAQLMEALGLQGRGGSGEGAAAVVFRCVGLLAQAGWGTARALNAVCRDWTEPPAQNVPVGHGTAKGWHRLSTL